MVTEHTIQKDLRDQIIDVIDGQHVSTYRDTVRLAQSITDLLVDLAGTGQLLASIDRLYR